MLTCVAVIINQEGAASQFKLVDERGNIVFSKRCIVERDLEKNKACLNPADDWEGILSGSKLGRYCLINEETGAHTENNCCSVIGEYSGNYLIANPKGKLMLVDYMELSRLNLSNAVVRSTRRGVPIIEPDCEGVGMFRALSRVKSVLGMKERGFVFTAPEETALDEKSRKKMILKDSRQELKMPNFMGGLKAVVRA